MRIPRPLVTRAAAGLLILLLAACGSVVVSGTLGEVGDEHAVHGSAAVHPSTPPGADGSIELVTDFAAGGSGVSVAEAIDVSSTQPVLVNGTVLRDAEGAIWVCDNVFLGSPPRCTSPVLLVVNFPTEPDLFDPAVADTVGATSRDGVTWLDGHQLFGVVHPPP